MREFIERAIRNHINSWLAERKINAESVVSIDNVGPSGQVPRYRLNIAVVANSDPNQIVPNLEEGWLVRWQSADVANVLGLPDPRRLERILWDLLPSQAYGI